MVRPLHEVFFVRAVLKKLGVGKLSTFNYRLKTQKVQYLAQVFKVSLPYTFSLYVHGPYSPDLTKDLFATENTPISAYDFASELMTERFERLEQFTSGKTNRELELIATYHWLLSAGFAENTSVEKFKELKDPNEKELTFTKEAIQEMQKIITEL